MAELRRAAQRVTVVVPRQHYDRYTVGHHLHFVPGAAPLLHQFGGRVDLVGGDWVLVADSPA